jgi:hypothetical protein
VVIAAVLSEAGVIAVLFAVIVGYTFLTPVTDAQYAALGEEVGYYVAPTAGAVMTLLSVLWATRGLTSGFIRNGIAVGVLGVVLTVGFIFGARPDHRVMYVVAFALRIAGGYAGGAIAQRRFSTRAARSTAAGQPA